MGQGSFKIFEGLAKWWWKLRGNHQCYFWDKLCHFLTKQERTFFGFFFPSLNMINFANFGICII
jgi:hypothetical protein